MIYLGQNAIGITDVIGVTPIDDTAGEGDTTKVWSADKSAAELGAVNEVLSYIEPSAYDATATYAVGDLCWHEGAMYRCNTAISTAEAWTAAHWTEIVFPKDVRVEGSSIVNADGVADIPRASSSDYGVVKINGWGLQWRTEGTKEGIAILPATLASIKDGYNVWSPITPQRQHESTFYGLAKAAGDSTQSASSNAVGTYTEAAKSAISEMLNAPVTVSGTTPSITAMAGVRYVCGECATLDITVPASGDVEIIFDSGSTATVLTVTPPSGVTAVQWANGFDPTALDANTRYDIIITDGEWGIAASWA